MRRRSDKRLNRLGDRRVIGEGDAVAASGGGGVWGLEKRGDIPPPWKTERTSPLVGNLKECLQFEKIEQISSQLYFFSLYPPPALPEFINL